MRALWLEGGRLDVREVPRPVPPRGEALVRVRLAGVCGTDLELLRGYYPFSGTPGHEFVGDVAAAPGAPEWEGRRVVGEIGTACGDCESCRRGRRTHCEARTVLGLLARHGAFAEYLTLPLANLHPAPDGMADEVAVFTEPAAAALHVLDAVDVGPGERVVVIGAGRLGLLVAQALRTAGCEPLVVGRDAGRLERVGRLGLLGGTADEVAPRSADVVVECTGNPEGLDLARRAVRACGTIVLKSTYHGEARVNLSSLVVDELRLIGSRCGPFAPALAALGRGALRVEPLIEARYELARAPEALEHAARPGALKVLIEL